MQKRILVLSGRIASGKSSVARLVENQFGYCIVKTRQLLINRPEAKGQGHDRKFLQELGRKLDSETSGTWVYEDLRQFMNLHPSAKGFIVDAVRIQGQVDIIRQHMKHDVTHVHLTAPQPVLQKRYMDHAIEQGDPDPVNSYREACSDPTEAQVEELGKVADALVDTDRSTVDDVGIRVAACLGLQSRPDSRLVDVLIGGQFGSEGKGQICAYLGAEYDVLMRVGGPNAGHKVFEVPEPYTFHQLPSATRSSKGHVIIGPGAVLAPQVLLREIKQCALTPERLTIDGHAMIIDPSDRKAERRLVTSIGSTGQGVGWATARRIRNRGSKSVRLAKHISRLKPFVRDSLEVLEGEYRSGKRILLEGTQGTGLSLYHGQYPHVTSRDTTVSGVLSEGGIPPSRVNRVIMVVRTYPIRVESPVAGDSGPMNKELTWEEIARRSGIPLEELQKTERTSTTNRQRRVSEFDWALFRKACLLNGPTDIALTFVDYLNARDGHVRRYEQLSEETIRFIDELERCAQAPVSLISNGFGPATVIDRRSWRSVV